MFSCGTEAMDWISNNCERCAKYNRESAADTECEFSNKLGMGFFGEAPTPEEGAAYNCNGDPKTKCSQLIALSA